MHVDPIKPKLNLPGTKRLKLKCDELLSTFAFKIKLRRYTKGELITLTDAEGTVVRPGSRSSHLPIPTLRFSCYELGPL